MVLQNKRLSQFIQLNEYYLKLVEQGKFSNRDMKGYALIFDKSGYISEFDKTKLTDAQVAQIYGQVSNDAMKTLADFAYKNALTEQEKQKARLMKDVVDNVDLNELPDYLRTFVIQSIFNPTQPIDNEAALKDELRDIVKDALRRRIEAEADESEASAQKAYSSAHEKAHEADKAGYQSDLYKHKRDKTLNKDV